MLSGRKYCLIILLMLGLWKMLGCQPGEDATSIEPTTAGPESSSGTEKGSDTDDTLGSEGSEDPSTETTVGSSDPTGTGTGGQTTGDNTNSDSEGTETDTETTGPPDPIYPPVDPLVDCDQVDILIVYNDTYFQKKLQLHLIMDALGYYIPNFLPDADVRVMAVNTREGWGDSECEATCPEDCEFWPGYGCSANVSVCDFALGAGVHFPDGQDKPCYDMVGEDRFVDGNAANFDQALHCMTQFPVVAEDNNQVVWAGLQALEHNCNSSFLRPNAELVIIFVTGKPDETTGLPVGWMMKIVSHKPDGLLDIVVGVFQNDHHKDNISCDRPIFGNTHLSDLAEESIYRVDASYCVDPQASVQEIFKQLQYACLDVLPDE